MASETPRSIAVIGSGAAGLGAAWLLARAQYNVHLFEADSRPGGHANTVDVTIPGTEPPATIPVDTGFMVYNTKTYPDLISLFELLAVDEENSSMSFSASVHVPGGQFLEWGSDSLATLFADRANLYRPAMYTMLYDVNRFNNAVYEFVQAAEDPTSELREVTLGQFLDHGAYSTIFIRAYLIPMVSAVWSASFNSSLEFPAFTLFHFFVNHGLAQMFARPQWRTPAKRSRDYVNRLLSDFHAHGGTLHLSSPVTQISRYDDYITLCVSDSSPLRFDDVIFATHPPDTLRILGSDATVDERRILSAFQYSTNKTYVHYDATLMPENRAVWSSWNFIGRSPNTELNPCELQQEKSSTDLSPTGTKIPISDQKISAPHSRCLTKTCQSLSNPSTSPKSRSGSSISKMTDIGDSFHTQRSQPESICSSQSSTFSDSSYHGQSSSTSLDDAPVCVSYWLNRLQNYRKYHLPVPDLFITLNPVIPIDPEKILAEISYDHPQFTKSAINAQSEIQSVIQGKGHTWFCGSYTRYGFHEDALMSGLDVVEKMTNNTVRRPWKMKNCLAINDNCRHYELPYSSLRSPLLIFLGAMLVVNAVISRLQAGLGKIAKCMTDRDPVVLVAGGQGRLHRFGPRHGRRRTKSFFAYSRLDELTTTAEVLQPSAARVSVRSPKVFARIADALRQGSDLAPTAAAAFAAGELDCPSPTDLSEMLRALFIADGLDDPSEARQGRAKLAENLLFVIVGKFDQIRSLSVHSRLPELTTCLLNVVSPSWWLEIEQSDDQAEECEPNVNTPIVSRVSPGDLSSVKNILEMLGDLSQITVELLLRTSACRATIVVQTEERISFVQRKADLLFVADQVTILLFKNFTMQQQTGIGLSSDLEQDDTKFDLILSPGIINNYVSCGFESVEEVVALLRSVGAPNATIEFGGVVYGKRKAKGKKIKHEREVDLLFCGDNGYRLWELTDLLCLADLDCFDLQHVAFLDEEEAAMDVYELIQRVYNSLGTEKLEANETRSVLAQMCLWQAALGVRYIRRIAMSFTLS